MPLNPYKTSPYHSKSVKRWQHLVRKNASLRTMSKYEMTIVHSLVRRHLRVLMGRESNQAPIPPSLSGPEKEGLLERFPEGDPMPVGWRQIVLPVILEQFNLLARKYKDQCNNPEVLEYHYVVAQKKKVLEQYRAYMIKSGASPRLVSIFQPRNYSLLGDFFEVKVSAAITSVNEVHFLVPKWWSKDTLSFIETIEKHVHFNSTSRSDYPGTIRPAHKYIPTDSKDYGVVTRHLPSDMYSNDFEDAGNDYYTSDEDVSDVELEDNSEIDSKTHPSDTTRLQDEIESLKGDLQKSNNTLLEFQNQIQQLMPIRLEELMKAKEDINIIKAKLDSLQNVGGGAQLENSEAEVQGVGQLKNSESEVQAGAQFNTAETEVDVGGGAQLDTSESEELDVPQPMHLSIESSL
ncbi:uncharacterized protein MELLADRAFT_103724 [Melampsora larici-populina 98AG31]|uniref:Uncharacterized protein n=1 Tax=Melampsora larici-populina (strain 98AG31 / pathotype 3-4-7) TaxID=747676 RepID=F4RC63_MELLP|nr:uncharacterized protein MELLADRAFT_103724 [Melampsora larici-populina 98AG31]EGG09681.1 hypothetical protein MELLADRAFT_103724 [Melampsora larici-populina 98AG31]